MHDDFSQIIYIDGVKRRCTPLAERIYVDSDELPCRRCSCHYISGMAVLHLKAGGAIMTNGHHYSLRAPNPKTKMEEPAPEPQRFSWRKHFQHYCVTYAAFAVWVLAMLMASLIGTK